MVATLVILSDASSTALPKMMSKNHALNYRYVHAEGNVSKVVEVAFSSVTLPCRQSYTQNNP